MAFEGYHPRQSLYLYEYIIFIVLYLIEVRCVEYYVLLLKMLFCLGNLWSENMKSEKSRLVVLIRLLYEV